MDNARKLGALLVAIASVATAQSPLPSAPSPDELHAILARISTNARQYDNRFHNFVCVESTRRSESKDSGQRWHLIDSLEEEVRYAGRLQSYQLLKVNGKPTKLTHDRVKGFRWYDLFATLEIFDEAARAEFNWKGWDTMDGRRMHVFTFHVPASSRRTRMFTDGVPKPESIFVGFHGVIWADADSSLVMRVQKIPEPPSEFFFQDGLIDLRYGFAAIANEPFLLPTKADIRMRSGPGTRFVWNEVAFRDCHRYAAESVIRFDDFVPDPHTAETKH